MAIIVGHLHVREEVVTFCVKSCIEIERRSWKFPNYLANATSYGQSYAFSSQIPYDTLQLEVYESRREQRKLWIHDDHRTSSEVASNHVGGISMENRHADMTDVRRKRPVIVHDSIPWACCPNPMFVWCRKTGTTRAV